MEGACIYAMSAAFFGEITAKKGAIQQSNFHDYPVVQMSNAPRRVEVHLVESEEPPGGVGEPGVPPFAPALCNRAEEHTSELQSLMRISYAVFCLKKKHNKAQNVNTH